LFFLRKLNNNIEKAKKAKVNAKSKNQKRSVLVANRKVASSSSSTSA
jgi:hypothetical protein